MSGKVTLFADSELRLTSNVKQKTPDSDVIKKKVP